MNRVSRSTLDRVKMGWDLIKTQTAVVKASMMLEQQFMDQDMMDIEGALEGLLTPTDPLKAMEEKGRKLLEEEDYIAFALLKKEYDELKNKK